MKVVIAIDSFKGSVSSLEGAKAIKQGINNVSKDIEVIIRPLADGGEGTVDTLIAGLGGKLQTVEVCGPLNKTVKANYGIINNLAIIEMASASGLALLPQEQRNPLYTTTYGVGQIIRDAIDKGCRDFIIGIGGSATNDGGVGMLQALGYEFLDDNGKEIKQGAIGLKDLKYINNDKVIKELKECHFNIACDVVNPICGENGCSAIYGYQKGANDLMVKQMDEYLLNYVNITSLNYPNVDGYYPGCGAAGGLGFAFLYYCNATLKSGIDLIIEATKLEDYIKDVNLVITGEGRLDKQSAMGKAVSGVCKIAKKYNKPVVALAGCIGKGASVVNEIGIDAYFPIIQGATSLEEAMDTNNTINNLITTSEQIMRLFTLSLDLK